MTGSEKDTNGAQRQQLGSSCLTPPGIVKGMTDKEVKTRGEHIYGIEGWKKWREDWTEIGKELRKRKKRKNDGR